MATVNYSSDIDTTAGTAVIAWNPLNVGPDDDGQAFDARGWHLASVQIAIVSSPYSGTFSFQASNDGTNWADIAAGTIFNPSTFRAVYFRPKVNGTSGQISCIAYFESK